MHKHEFRYRHFPYAPCYRRHFRHQGTPIGYLESIYLEIITYLADLARGDQNIRRYGIDLGGSYLVDLEVYSP